MFLMTTLPDASSIAAVAMTDSLELLFDWAEAKPQA